jgi:type I restriction-modification system DNA methylase subunit
VQAILEGKRKLLKLLKSRQIQEPEYLPHSITEPLKKKKGIYYTPLEISTYLMFEAIIYSITDILNEAQLDIFNYFEQSSHEEIQRVLGHLDTIKILDPACGAGIFLIEAAEILFQLKKYILAQLNQPINPYSIKRAILLNNIYGVDLFEDAIQNTQTRLLHWLRENFDSTSEEASRTDLEWNIRLGNSLIGWVS